MPRALWDDAEGVEVQRLRGNPDHHELAVPVKKRESTCVYMLIYTYVYVYECIQLNVCIYTYVYVPTCVCLCTFSELYVMLNNGSGVERSQKPQ